MGDVATLPRWTLALFLFAVPLAAQDRPDLRNLARFKYKPTAAELDPLLHDAWYGIYLNDTKVGYGQVTYERGTEGYEATTSIKMKFTRMGTNMEVVVRSRMVFDPAPPFALRQCFHRKRTDDVVVETRARREGPGRFAVTSHQKGGSQTRTVERIDFTLVDHVAQLIWAREHPQPGSELTTLRLDLDTWQLGAARMRVEATKRAGGEDLQRVAVLGAGGKKVAQMMLDARGITAREAMPGGLEMRIEPRTEAKELAETIDVLESTAAPIDKDLGDPKRVVRLKVEVTGADKGRLESATRQLVTKDAAGNVVLELDTRAAGTPVTHKEQGVALAETAELPHTNPKIQAFATQATRGASTPWEKVQKLVRAVHGHITYDLEENAFDALKVLETRRGDCSEYALLLAASCRALGIPARPVSGLGYVPEARAFGGHAWTEVVIDGRWVAVDACWDEAPVDAVHIRLGEFGSWNGTRMRFRVLEVERR